MFKTPIISIGFVAFAALLGAIGQFLFKSATNNLKVGVLNFFTHPKIILGMICYLSVMGFFTYAFKKGGSVTVLYPIYASTFIWAAFIAKVLYKQPILSLNYVGMVLLVSGMLLMGIQN